MNGTISESDRAMLETDISVYMLSNAVPACLLFLVILLYFPSQPRTPPSRSSHQARLDTKAAFR